MTDELLTRATQLHHTINDLDNQIQIIENMHHCDTRLCIECDGIGRISIAGDDELKDDVLDLILNRLNAKKEEVEDEYRML